MSDRQLYTLAVPNDAQVDSSRTLRQSISKQGTVSDGQPVADSVSLQPGEFLLRGQYRGQYAGKMARELEELFDAAAVNAVPYFGTSATDSRDGYYSLQDVSAGALQPQEEDVATFDGKLVRTGSRRTHWRALSTDQVQVENDFGTDQTAYVGVFSSAEKIRWVDVVAKSREVPTLQATRSGEQGDIEIYDVDASTFTDSDGSATLMYDISYADEGKAAPVVWDDRGNSSREDGSGNLQWAKVFDPAHEYIGTPVVSNKLVRLTFDEATNSLSVEEWDNGTSTWSSVSLGSSDWELYDFDAYRIGVERVEAQVEFRDTTQTPTAYHPLDMVLHRGYLWPQWLRPQDLSGTTTPSGLQTLLDPVANGDVLNPQEEQIVLRRKEVRR